MGGLKRPTHKDLVHCCHSEAPLTLLLCRCPWASDPGPFSAHFKKGGECFTFVFLKMDFFPLILVKLWLAIKFYVENHSFWSHCTIIFQNPLLLLKTLCLYCFDSYSLEVIFSITLTPHAAPGTFRTFNPTRFHDDKPPCGSCLTPFTSYLLAECF